MTDQLQYQIALTNLPQVGAITAKTLVSYCGSAEAVFQASRRGLLKIPGIGPGIVESISNADALRKAEQEIEFLEQHQVNALFYTDERYPVRLRQNADCPAILYFKGSSADLLNANRIVAIVGTRQPTDYGRAMCEELVDGLRAYDVLVISGLAYGIDITAHRKASATGIANVAVLGHGLGSIYPSQHRQTALKLIEHGGLLSEYTHQTKPDREHFPMRNRIIAGMCDALLVVETPASGGSIITAELGCQYERDIFAIPGRSNDPKSAGCNALIRNQKAKLVESADEIASSMNWDESGRPRIVQAQLFLELSPDEMTIVDLLRQQAETPIDELSFNTQLSPGLLASLLLGLEFKGLVRTLPGKRYVLVG